MHWTSTKLKTFALQKTTENDGTGLFLPIQAQKKVKRAQWQNKVNKSKKNVSEDAALFYLFEMSEFSIWQWVCISI